jgi:hypothetical protein
MRAVMATRAIRRRAAALRNDPVYAALVLAGLCVVAGSADGFGHVGRMGELLMLLVTRVASQRCVHALLQLLRRFIVACGASYRSCRLRRKGRTAGRVEHIEHEFAYHAVISVLPTLSHIAFAHHAGRGRTLNIVRGRDNSH